MASLGKALGSAASGVSTGASLGSIVPGIGTAVGGVVGGIGGLLSSLLGGGSPALPAPQLAPIDFETNEKLKQLIASGGTVANPVLDTSATKAAQELEQFNSLANFGVLKDPRATQAQPQFKREEINGVNLSPIAKSIDKAIKESAEQKKGLEKYEAQSKVLDRLDKVKLKPDAMGGPAGTTGKSALDIMRGTAPAASQVAAAPKAPGMSGSDIAGLASAGIGVLANLLAKGEEAPLRAPSLSPVQFQQRDLMQLLAAMGQPIASPKL